MDWSYDGDFTFLHRHHVEAQLNGSQIDTNIYDDYNIGIYTYQWYINTTLQQNTTDSIMVPLIRSQTQEYTVITYDNSYYASAKINLEETKIDIKFLRRGSTLTAVMVGDPIILRKSKLCI